MFLRNKSLSPTMLVGLLLVGPCMGDVIFDVSLDTSPLMAHPAGPFSLFIQLNDGSGTGNANNTATLSNFTFGTGGSAAGIPITSGGGTGDLTSGVTLIDSDAFNYFLQDFVPGSSLQFRLNTTTNAEGGFAHDSLLISILDATLTEIPTLGGQFFDVIFALNINGPALSPAVFASDESRDPAAAPGFPISMDAPVVAQVPEPSSTWFLATTIFIVFGSGFLRKRKRLKS